MIEFFYRTDYEDFEVEKFRRHAEVHAIAAKYEIDKLCEKARQKFWDANIKCWDSEAFLNSISTVYLRTPDQVRGLRNLARRCARIHFNSLGTDINIEALWRETCTSVPEFAFDLLKSFYSNPLLGHCSMCGHGQPLEALQLRCLKYNKGGASMKAP